MSRLSAGTCATSCPSSRICPELGSSSPAIIRSVVVLPQPEGPSSMKNSPSPTVKLESSHRDEVAELLAQVADDDLGQRRYSGKWLTTMNITVPARMVDEGPGEELDRERLHQHDDARRAISTVASISHGPRRRRARPASQLMRTPLPVNDG